MDNRRENFQADGFAYVDIDKLGIPNDLFREIQNKLTDKEVGSYFISFKIEETRIEKERMQIAVQRKIILDTFYKGIYGNPEKYYYQ